MSNRLIKEKSPYLQHHSDNPVDWYPWCDEAFLRADKEDKPIFLSIGYSTCHWCHVMAQESFEDTEIAGILSRSFVSVKVDREERQDIDTVYMAVCEAMTGSGGWPLTIIMTPDKKPFFAATYLPKESIYGVGLKEVLLRTEELWKSDRQRLQDSAESICDFIGKPLDTSSDTPSKELVQKAVNELMLSYDSKNGGFGKAPKFPTPHKLMFLTDYAVYEKDEKALQMVQHTLDMMYRGGIYDHIGGGFSRYSTDDKWLIPHFEKTLYDNALLVLSYLRVYKLTNEPLYKRVIERTLGYVLRELQDKSGGFFCGQDADSEGEEGLFYAFTEEELIRELGSISAERFSESFGISKEGNFEGKSIPNLLKNPNYRKKDEIIQSIISDLYCYRLGRTRLLSDTKILTAWNSMMISALCEASLILGKSEYLNAAKKTQEFIEDNLKDTKGRLYVRYCDGESAFDGTIDDYAFYACSLLSLYKSTFDCEYLIKAAETADMMLELFFDYKNGGFYLYSRDAEKLITRPKETYDRAAPSGNSAASHVLCELSDLTGEVKWIKARDLHLGFMTAAAKEYPSAHSFALSAMMKIIYPSAELICCSGDNKCPKDLFDFIKASEFPDLPALLITESSLKRLTGIAPLVNNFPIPNVGVKYYVCTNGTCHEPTDNILQVKKLLNI